MRNEECGTAGKLESWEAGRLGRYSWQERTKVRGYEGATRWLAR